MKKKVTYRGKDILITVKLNSIHDSDMGDMIHLLHIYVENVYFNKVEYTSSIHLKYNIDLSIEMAKNYIDSCLDNFNEERELLIKLGFNE